MKFDILIHDTKSVIRFLLNNELEWQWFSIENKIYIRVFTEEDALLIRMISQ